MQTTREIQNLTAAQFRDALAAVPTSQRVLLDVRTPIEFDDGYIPHAMLIPVQELTQRIGEVPSGRTVFVYCGHGRRSLRAAEILAAHGHGPIVNLVGGIAAWPFEVAIPD